ncbi:methyltransferase domain-containing protein [Cytophagaceae bacterium ABcell3]|nr:methyltransferase domain-containing protein [Cytophagaceae bacterium ABcell3]
MWQILNDNELLKGKVLDFSPNRCLHKNFKKTLKDDYISTDYEGEFFADYAYDITGIFEPNNKFDLVICYHILEHIPEDQKAINELHRVLKIGGKCYIQTPFKEGDTYEDPSITTPEERKKHFGQEDHVRIYSVEGLKNRLQKAGFKVTPLNFAEGSNNYFGFKEKETVLLAEKIL